MIKNEKGSGAIIGIIIAIIIIIGVAFWLARPAKNNPASTSSTNDVIQTPEISPNQNQTNIPQTPSTPSTGTDTNMPATQTTQITIKNFAFSPNALTVKAGTTVVWTNGDSTAHTVTGDNFNSGQIEPGKTFQFTFSTPGTFSYHCSIHPTMTGEVVVQ